MSQTVGGRADITIDGRVYHVVADLELEEINFEAEAVTNQDGTVGRTVKPKPFKAPIKLRYARDLDLERLMTRFFDFSLVERDTGQSIMLTGAFMTGTPKRNTATGEIDGLTIEGEKYRRRQTRAA
jgi:hypothetical protein